MFCAINLIALSQNIITNLIQNIFLDSYIYKNH